MRSWDKFSPLFGTAHQEDTENNGVAYQLRPMASWSFALIHQFQTSSGPYELIVDPGSNLFSAQPSPAASMAAGSCTNSRTGHGKKQFSTISATPPIAPMVRHPLAACSWTPMAIFSAPLQHGGTDYQSNHDKGVVFERTAGGSYKVLYNFCSRTNCADGEQPFDGLVMDSSGNLFGTSGFASMHNGNVFELQNSGGNWSEAVLYAQQGELCRRLGPQLAADHGCVRRPFRRDGGWRCIRRLRHGSIGSHTERVSPPCPGDALVCTPGHRASLGLGRGRAEAWRSTA